MSSDVRAVGAERVPSSAVVQVGELTYDVWSQLRDEVMQARAAEGVRS